MHRRLPLTGILLLLPILLGAGGQAPRWPLDLPTRYLTSNYMEHRPGRYHAGLDLKTRSLTGFPVRAVTDGSIVRIRATARAYGRALYLQADDGTTYVYAHLERFNDEIRARVEAARGRSGAYRTELYLKPGELRVERGRILALSGQSGTGGPHLHFEVRDAAQRPLNPLDHGFAVPDTIPPRILRLRALPAGPGSRVFGSAQVHVLEGEDLAPLSGLLDTLAISGPVALTARVLDHADIRGHILEPMILQVRLDGELVYRARNGEFAFGQNDRQFLEWFQGGGVRERWLFRREGVDLPGREGGPWYLGPFGGGLAAGLHRLEVLVADQAGGQAAIEVPLLVVDPGDPGPAAGRWRVADGAARSGHPLAENPFLPAFPDSAGLVRALDPQAGDPVKAPMMLWSGSWPVEKEALDSARRQGLTYLGWPTDFRVSEWVVEGGLQAALWPDGGEADAAGILEDPRVGVYRWTGEDWAPAGYPVQPEQGGGPGLLLGTAGRFALLADRTPPRLAAAARDSLVAGPGPVSAWEGITLPRWRILPLGLQEDGSGIAPETIRATLDGRPLILEPDLPRSRLLVELPDTLAAGPHNLALTLADEAGNEASFDLRVTCPER